MRYLQGFSGFSFSCLEASPTRDSAFASLANLGIDEDPDILLILLTLTLERCDLLAANLEALELESDLDSL